MFGGAEPYRSCIQVSFLVPTEIPLLLRENRNLRARELLTASSLPVVLSRLFQLKFLLSAEMLRGTAAIVCRGATSRAPSKPAPRSLHRSRFVGASFSRGAAQPRATPRAFVARSAPPPQEVEEYVEEEHNEGRLVNDQDEGDEGASGVAYAAQSYGHSKYGDSTASRTRGPPSPMMSIYRPNREMAKGSAAQFSFSANRKASYLTLAKQQGEKTAPGSSERQFNWDAKLVFKLDVPGMFAVRLAAWC